MEQALGLDFALRPRADAEEAGSSCACEAALDLAFSLRGRFGLSCAHAAALCEVVSAGGGAARPLGELRAAAAATLARRGLAAERARPRALEPRLALTVSAVAARALGSAAGWRLTPAGNASFAWTFSSGAGSLRLRAAVPFAAEGAPLELPLALFRAGARVRVSLGGAPALAIDGEGHVRNATAAAATWRPEVSACAGVAARHVSGRVPRGAECGGGRVLVLRVPGGAHELALEEER